MKIHLKISSVKWQPFCPGGDSKLTEAEWHIYASANYTIIGSDNGLSPITAAKPFSEPILGYYQLDPEEQTFIKF